ncbi:MAG: NrsF family protein [Paenirhodobacter sp.]|uniref:NrsF family protein n=1 Tax=Paenirhodobacter sp. TaxID=1965326 RepID=UPI003D0CFF0E
MSTPDQTEALIARLAAAPAPAPLAPGRMLALAGAGLAASLCGLLAVLGLRADWFAAIAQPVVAAKMLLPLAIGLLALAAALASTHPGRRVPLWPLLAPLAVAVALFAARALETPPGGELAELMGQTAAACLLSITLVSALPLGLGLAALRRGASTRPALTGGLYGLAVGGFAVVGYTLHCPEDSPMFYVTWYGLGMGISAALGAVVGRRLLRW